MSRQLKPSGTTKEPRVQTRRGQVRGAAAAMEFQAKSREGSIRPGAVDDDKLSSNAAVRGWSAARSCEIGRMLTWGAGESWSRGRLGRRRWRVEEGDPDEDAVESKGGGETPKC